MGRRNAKSEEEMKETQYAKILKALRKAGNKGCTIRELQAYSNYPWARIREMTTQNTVSEWVKSRMLGKPDIRNVYAERIERHERQHNGRTIRVYVLKRVK